MIDLKEKDRTLVCEILRRHIPNAKVLAFGSRVSGKASQFSDLDLALVSTKPLDWRELEKLRDAFSESDLPISVDLLDYHEISAEFRTLIEKNHVVLEIG